MSSTTIHVFGSDGRRDYGRDRGFRNGHTSPVLWRILWRKYLARRGTPGYFNLLPCDAEGYEVFPFETSQLEPFWKLHEDPRLAWFERLSLRSTFDHVVVRREHFSRLAEAFNLFTAAHVEPEPKHVWHLPGYAAYLRELADDETVLGVGWTQTSVVDMFLPEYAKDPDMDEGLTEGAPYNLNTRSEHWFMELEGDEVG